jgi:hypothetical protein
MTGNAYAGHILMVTEKLQITSGNDYFAAWLTGN